MNRPDCKHPSAFCTMRYQTPDRNVEETVWNSRDMAVPDEVTVGKLKLAHVDAHRDEFKPFHVPRVGSRMWIDPVMDKAEAAAAEYFAEHQHDDDFAKEFGDNERDALAKIVALELKKLEDTAVKRGPVLVVVTADLATKVEAKLKKKGVR